MPTTASLDREKKLIFEHFQAFLSEIRDAYNNIPLKKRDFSLNLKLKQELRESELSTFDDVERVFLKTQERDKKFKSKWQKEEVDLFIFLVFYLSKKVNLSPENFERDHWVFISRHFLERNWKQCLLKWRNLLRFNPLSKKWSKDEDFQLVEIIKSYETQRKPLKWTRIADELFERGPARLLRLGKHCRERWNNHLNPALNKGEWSEEEDVELLTHILKIGKKWSQISREMAGRNEYSVKNRYYYLMKANKLDAQNVADNEIRRICEKKQEIAEQKRLTLPRTQPVTAGLQTDNINPTGPMGNPPNLALQSLVLGYQNYLQYQSFCYFRRNMDLFFTNMQKFMTWPQSDQRNLVKMEDQERELSLGNSRTEEERGKKTL